MPKTSYVVEQVNLKLVLSNHKFARHSYWYLFSWCLVINVNQRNTLPCWRQNNSSFLFFAMPLQFLEKHLLSWKPQVQSIRDKRLHTCTTITDEHQCNFFFPALHFTVMFTQYKVFSIGVEPPSRNRIKCLACLSEINHMQHGKGHKYWEGMGIYVSQRKEEMHINWRFISSTKKGRL